LVTEQAYIAPHLKVGLGVIRPVVITVGDPFRCEIVAKLCDQAKEIQWNREYRLFNITFEGVELSCISHGIGGPGAAICFEELIKLGATTIMRLGTCGSLKPKEIRQGDLIVTMAAAREDGHS
jgi:uridine phosphorylase